MYQKNIIFFKKIFLTSAHKKNTYKNTVPFKLALICRGEYNKNEILFYFFIITIMIICFPNLLQGVAILA